MDIFVYFLKFCRRRVEDVGCRVLNGNQSCFLDFNLMCSNKLANCVLSFSVSVTVISPYDNRKSYGYNYTKILLEIK